VRPRIVAELHQLAPIAGQSPPAVMADRSRCDGGLHLDSSLFGAYLYRRRLEMKGRDCEKNLRLDRRAEQNQENPERRLHGAAEGEMAHRR
jgi:hypothetical protein